MDKEQKDRSGSSKNRSKKKADPEHSEEKSNETLVDASTLQNLESERDEYYDRLLRTQAEFDNYRKRTDREKVDVRMESQSGPILELLPILDACEKGLETLGNASDDAQVRPFYEGYELLVTQLRSVLTKFEVKVIPGVGSQFDPNLHEAVLREFTTDCEDGAIAEEYRKGYTIRGRLLRASQVKVALHPPVEAKTGE
jgi:molecular chaperone GrpE